MSDIQCWTVHFKSDFLESVNLKYKTSIKPWNNLLQQAFEKLYYYDQEAGGLRLFPGVSVSGGAVALELWVFSYLCHFLTLPPSPTSHI